jgi:protein-disulfide isomerase
VKKSLRICLSAVVAHLAVAVAGAAQQPKPAAAAANASTAARREGGGSSALQKSIEAYLRHLYAFGPDVALEVGTPKDTEVAGLEETTVRVKIAGNEENAKFFVSRDGRFLFRGEMSDLTKDPLAEARAQLQLRDTPMLGDPQAPIEVVEFSDFECPVCRSLHDVLRGLLPKYPQVRVYFKDYPIEQIHPWARTAAIAGRCAYQQDPKAFWKMYDLIYDGQELISAANAYNKMVDFAGQAGVNPEAMKSCLAAPEAGAAVDASRSNGQKLDVTSTPTIFINGRRMVGADPRLLEQFLDYEVAQLKGAGKK